MKTLSERIKNKEAKLAAKFFQYKHPELEDLVMRVIFARDQTEQQVKNRNLLFEKINGSDRRELVQRNVNRYNELWENLSEEGRAYLLTSKRHVRKRAERLEIALSNATSSSDLDEQIRELEKIEQNLLKVDFDIIKYHKITKKINTKYDEFVEMRTKLENETVGLQEAFAYIYKDFIN